MLLGEDPLNASSMKLAIDEDQLLDSERAHTTEQVAFMVFGSEAGGAAAFAEDIGEEEAAFDSVYESDPMDSPNTVDWLHEFEQADMPYGSTDEDNHFAAVVDLLLAN